jgi:TrmH family RNA methyltransferase
MITSVKNPKIQHIRALQSRSRKRREVDAFIVEGLRLAEEAYHSSMNIQLLIYTENLPPDGITLVNSFAERGVEVELVAPHVMQSASNTKSPQGILLVLPTARLTIPTQPDLILILDNLRDPGNLGTILRTAAAVGVDTVYIPPLSADPFSPKVVRAGMGAHFRTPIINASWEMIVQTIEQHNLQVYLSKADGSVLYTKADFRQPVALIVGGEASGPSKQSHAISHQSLHIPMLNQVESLNAAVAAGVLLYEVHKQRALETR